jgi:hypothetical protein
MKTTCTLIILLSIQLFAGIGVGESTTTPLPVELTSFTANLSGSNVELRWVTATEVRNYGFELERSLTQTISEGKGFNNWERIGFVEGHGNSNSPRQYFFGDNVHNGSGYLSYRLKQIDTDGKFSYSNTISVLINQIPSNYELHQNYPNPFNPTTIISYSIPQSSNVVLTIYDILGNLVETLVNENQEAGNYEISFNAGELSNGIYYYKIQSGNFIATKKMLLLK